MAKARPGRRSSSQLLRLQRLATLNQIAGLCAVLPVASAFTPSNWNELQRAGRAKLSVAKALHGDRVCRSSKRGAFRSANRQPKGKQRRRTPWSPSMLRGSHEIQASK